MLGNDLFLLWNKVADCSNSGVGVALCQQCVGEGSPHPECLNTASYARHACHVTLGMGWVEGGRRARERALPSLASMPTGLCHLWSIIITRNDDGSSSPHLSRALQCTSSWFAEQGDFFQKLCLWLLVLVLATAAQIKQEEITQAKGCENILSSTRSAVGLKRLFKVSRTL